MNTIYPYLNEKKFKFLTIIVCFITDLCTSAYLYLQITSREKFDSLVELSLTILRAQNPQMMGQLPPHFQNELWHLIVSTTLMFIIIFIVSHCIIYIFHLYNKDFAKSYIKFYCWSAGILLTIGAITGITQITTALLIIPGAMMLVVANGFKKFKKTEE